MNDVTSYASRPDERKSIDSPLYGVVSLDFLDRGELHPCPYLPGNTAREEGFSTFEFPPELYHDFMNHGFRRSGLHFYRPICPACRECRPIRIPVDNYRPSKSQRRVFNKNQDIEIRIDLPRFTQDKFKMYSDYIASQHLRGSDISSSSLRSFLYTSPIRTAEFEYRLGRRLLAVGIVDICSRSLSSVYAFYDPDFCSKSLGTFSAIQEIMFCRRRTIPHYYLGFFIKDSASMKYKTRFRQHEILNRSHQWICSELV